MKTQTRNNWIFVLLLFTLPHVIGVLIIFITNPVQYEIDPVNAILTIVISLMVYMYTQKGEADKMNFEVERAAIFEQFELERNLIDLNFKYLTDDIFKILNNYLLKCREADSHGNTGVNSFAEFEEIQNTLDDFVSSASAKNNYNKYSELYKLSVIKLDNIENLFNMYEEFAGIIAEEIYKNNIQSSEDLKNIVLLKSESVKVTIVKNVIALRKANNFEILDSKI